MTGVPGSDASPMVALRGVRFAYASGGAHDEAPGAVPALACDALDVGAGLTLVVGPNGAGKSTLLRLVAGVERPHAGTVALLGHDLWRDGASEVAARRALAYVPEHPEIAPYASVDELLQLVARLRGEPDDAAPRALDAVGLGALGHRTVRELSMGQRRRALLAAAWIGSPRVLVLDEPLEAMDRPTRAAVVAWVAARRDAGAAVLVATHEIAPFLPMVDRVLAVADGRLAWMPVSELPR